MEKAVAVVRMLRMPHYIKNLLIYVPLMFSYGFSDGGMHAWKVTEGFCLFCISSSVVYVMNDIADREEDRNHPRKSKRPLAAGILSVEEAALTIMGLLILMAAGTVLLWKDGSFAVWMYLLLNVAYTFWLKHIPIFDILVLSLCFMVRVWFGCLLLHVQMSSWLYLTTLAFSLYMSAGKRNGELMTQLHSGEVVRKVLSEYTDGYLKSVCDICFALTVVFYSLWSTSAEIEHRFQSEGIRFSTIFIVVILLRYHMDVFGAQKADPVSVVYGDRILMGLIIVYVLFMLSCITGIL